MKLVVQRRLDRVAGTLLCAILSALCPGKARPANPMPVNILVIMLSEMGSLVLARPMFDYLKGKYPFAGVHVLLFERNREALELLDIILPGNIHSIDDRTLPRFLKSSVTAVRRLRRARIDAVLDCELFSRVSSIYSVLCGAGVRVGFHPYTQEGLYRGGFINRPVLYNPYNHISHQFLTLAKAMEQDGVPTVKREVPRDPIKMPPLQIPPAEVEEYARKLRAAFAQLAGKKLVLIYPGGGLLPIRAWPITSFCTLARGLLRNGYAVGVIGMEGDRHLSRVILEYCGSPECVDLAGYTKTVRELIILLHTASLLITNDGGPVHFAALTPTPSITFFGPETPLLYGPLSARGFVFFKGLSCSPCLTAYNHRNSPCDGNNRCLRMILPEDVLVKARELLEEEP